VAIEEQKSTRSSSFMTLSNDLSQSPAESNIAYVSYSISRAFAVNSD
jgi:hypothetical protein